MSFFNSFSRGFGRSSKKNKASAPLATISDQSSGAVAGDGLDNYSNHGGSNSQLSFHSNNGGTGGHGPQHTNGPSKAVSTSKPALFLCQPFVRTALVRGSFQTIVQLPKYVDLNEWMVLNVFEFYQYLGQFVGVLSEFITPQACPTMNAGPGIDYLWIDSSKKAVRLPANTYIDYVMTWIGSKFDDTSLFPTKQGVPFPPQFLGVLKNICRQMFRIFAHIYHNHFDKIIHLSMEAHWNSFFAHFISFGKEFDLLDRKEMEPLAPLIESMESNGKIL